MPIERNAVDQRRRFGIGLSVGYLFQQQLKTRTIAELDPGRILARRRIEVARQRDARMPRVACVFDPLLRTAQDFAHRYGGIGRDRYERRVGAILQKPPHQIGEQVAMPADRRIDTARRARLAGDQRRV